MAVISVVWDKRLGLGWAYSDLRMKTETAQWHETLSNEIARIILERRGEVTIAGVSRQVGASPTLCREAFSDFAGETIDHFCRRIRIERAAVMLAQGKDQVGEIGVEVGYATASGFTRGFNAHFHCNPSTFQNLNPNSLTFPSYASSECLEPLGDRIDIGVYTGIGAVTTFCYDGFRLLERQNPLQPTQEHLSPRSSADVCEAILRSRDEDPNRNA